MATDLERLVVQLSADIKGYENAMRRAQGVTQRQTRAIESQWAKSNKAISTSFAGLGRSFAAAFAGGATLSGAQQLIDSATRIQNALKVAGLSGDRLTQVYDRLFASAQKNAAPLETLVTLYSRASQVADGLGATQEELIGFTDNVALALRVAGTDAQAASGALLQLGQALGSGIVRAEEFNSINEAAQPILKAVAAGLKEAGGDVAKLRTLVTDGKVSSEAFFRAFEAGASILRDQVAGAALTMGQAFTRLQNTLIDSAGRLDKVTGASTAAGAALERLAGIVRGLSAVFEAAANGPIGSFIARLGQINELIKSVLPGMAGLNLLTEQNLNDFAGFIDGISEGPASVPVNPAGKGGRVVKDPIQSRIDAAFGTDVKPVSLADFKLPGEKKSKGSKQRENDYAREIRQIQERTAAIRAETAAMAGLNPLVEDYGFAVEKARAVQDLLTAAQRAGVAVTPELKATIDSLATGYAAATAEAERLQEKQDKVRRRADEMRDLGRDVMGGFINDLVKGKSAADALASALGKVGQKFLDLALDDIFSSKKSGGGGFFSGLLGSLFGGGKLSVGLYHTGGAAGAPPGRRAVDPTVFNGAQRYHDGGIAGLKPGEVPAILQRGEMVIPRGIASRKAGSTTIAPVYNIDARGAQQGVGAEITAALKAYDKGRLARLSQDFPELKRRGAIT